MDKLRSLYAHLAQLPSALWGAGRLAGQAGGRTLARVAEDLLILSGLAIIVGATFRLSVTAGLYALGVVLVSVGTVLARHPPGGR